jgi:cytochrome c-type biogenesis protein CcmH/NrfG
MGKKQKEKKETPKPVVHEARTVRVETTAIIALIALVVGFFGGEIIRLSKPQGPAPSPSSAPPAGAPAMPPQAAPQAKGPSPEQARKIMELEKKVVAEPGNVAAWTELGHYYFDTGQFQKAIDAYKKSLALNPYDANVLTDMGVMYRRVGKPKEALAAFEKAMKIDPKHEVSRFNKGIVLMGDLNDVQGAIQAWEELLKVNPNAKGPSGESIKNMIEQIRTMKSQQ